ncbi:ADP-ribose pyrophosphatase YjhB, NUDIX family [Paracoccus isoporae]|uniref:ADP-ribose pyrophosphatase YjhB, NUDIX family n=1 Tax=Paracoccus isoporae TaxID=591205 RepID=A0A1G7AM14_9RHOB|nr:NUDIX hydrolase [Paracoccus isoporae]SDE15783.1 ADP-ribose pyrophosphatase YjhB, NUDIX family [Paracoccus isoporae]
MARPRLAVRAAILRGDRLLVVNAYPPEYGSDLWCLPGGGAEAGQSLHENLIREVMEETGLSITVGAIILVNEFKDSKAGFHQVDLIHRATLSEGDGSAMVLADPEGVVDRARWVTRSELAKLHHRPRLLARAVWSDHAAWHDPMEETIW